jgi:hypothetical protein
MAAMAEALRAAGVTSAAERLANIARKAVAASPRNWDAAKAAFWREVQGDPVLLWELLAPYRHRAADPYLAVAAQQARQAAEHRSGGGQRRSDNHSLDAPSAPQPGASRSAAATNADQKLGELTKLSLLDTFKINGRPIGDLTPPEAIGWAGARERDARFVRLLTANLPPDHPIKKFRTGDDAAACYAQAEADRAE